MTAAAITATLTLFAAATPTSSSATESAVHRHHVKRDAVTCPAETRQVVETAHDGATLEYCLDAKGQRHGYFLRWYPGAAAWAQLGSYNHGRKDGRWIAFSEDGRPTLVSYFTVGTPFRPWEMVEDDESDEAVAAK